MYGDDGEMQCGECLRDYGFCDWKRTPAAEIESKIIAANMKKLVESWPQVGKKCVMQFEAIVSK